TINREYVECTAHSQIRTRCVPCELTLESDHRLYEPPQYPRRLKTRTPPLPRTVQTTRLAVTTCHERRCLLALSASTAKPMPPMFSRPTWSGSASQKSGATIETSGRTGPSRGPRSRVRLR